MQSCGFRAFGRMLGLGDLAEPDVCSRMREALQRGIHGSLPGLEGRVGLGERWGSPDMPWGL